MDKVTFTVNGVSYSVGCDVTSKTSLLQYLRRNLGLHGTKYMCEEGGCGACIVSVVKNQGESPQSINSCLVMITSCHGWEITTIEKVGNKIDGYHPLQKTLADNNGSQCGYCSPGMIMNMYSFLKSKPRTMVEIERALGSNLCRCTGYRPIIQSFQKFASDASTPSTLAIEDLKLTCCSSDQSDKCCQQKSDQDWCMVSRNEVHAESVLHIKLSDDRDWYRVNCLSDILDLWKTNGLESYMLVAGNTAKGVSPMIEYPKMLIDVSHLSELKGYSLDQNLVIGAGYNLLELINILENVSTYDGFGYCPEITYHLDQVAHVTVRNLGSLGGNMMIKKQNPGFQSDVYLFLETVGAEMTIMDSTGLKRVISMQAFLAEDMTGKIIVDFIIPPLSDLAHVRTYKIMPRMQSVHAFVNAGFYYKLNTSNIVEECRIVYGALSTHFTRAFKAERYLIGKNLFLNETLQRTLDVLTNELVVAEGLNEPSVKYRRQLALGLFYKSVLSLCPENTLSSWYSSGAKKHRESRPASQGHQVFDTNPDMWPITKPLPKTDGLIQCAGEAQYTDDIPLQPGELFVAFVLSKVALGTISNIDTTKAFKEKGVVAFFSAKDIPGVNTFIPAPNSYNLANEELFCDGQVKYFNQVIGVIVAESQATATHAATLVEVSYTDERKPVIDINVARKDSTRTATFQTVEATSKGTETTKVITGTDTVYGQYHAPMETCVCVVHIVENGLRMYCTTQWIDLVHQTVSRALALDQNKIEVCNRRLGGAYGLKIGRANQVSTAAALVAHKLNRPCRMVTPLIVNMRAMGKRMPCARDFEVGVNDSGVIQHVKCDLYGDNGYIVNEPLLALGMDVYFNTYNSALWNYTCYNVITDTPSNTWCRSPGTLENIAMAELMMERIAWELKLDPLEVRKLNLSDSCRDDILEMVETLKSNARYEERKKAVDTFNKSNRWTKRGMAFSFLNWKPLGYINLDVNLCVYADDGTVVITHGGIEMGQGVNAKAIQIASYLLKISVDKIQVKPNDSIIAPNCGASGGSITSQNVGIGVRRCCEELLKRLAPIKSAMDSPTWVELIQKAYASQVDLQVHAYTTSADMVTYDICGVALAECEIDVLTGEFQILHVDMIEDAGQSINPELDIGQIEGAFTMAVGYWTCENLVYDTTGECVSNRFWYYWLPQACDIAQDMRVYLKKRAYSSDVIFGSKGTGEPAACMGLVVYLALKSAIEAARVDSGASTEWLQLEGPMGLDKICTGAATKTEEFKLY